MANYYTHFSFMVALDCDCEWLRELWSLLDVDRYHREGTEHPLFTDVEFVALPAIAADRDGLWFHDEAGESDLEVTIALVQWVLGQPGTPDTVGFEWASVCSAPRVDGFGGGAALVSAANATSVHTTSKRLWSMLADELADADDADD